MQCHVTTDTDTHNVILVTTRAVSNMSGNTVNVAACNMLAGTIYSVAVCYCSVY